MKDKSLEKQGIHVSLTTKGNVVKGEYYRFTHPYSEEEKALQKATLEPFQKATKEKLEADLLLHHQNFDSIGDQVLETMYLLMEEKKRMEIIEIELLTLKRIEEAKQFIEKNQGIFNQVIKTEEDGGEIINVSLQNKVYKLLMRIVKPSYIKNHVIYFSLGLNEDIFRGKAYGYNIERIENTSYSEYEQVETYINNKIKKYGYLFELDDAMLKEHQENFHIPVRFIKDLGLQLFDDKEALKMQKKSVVN
ncbi:hypothetical protein PP175_29545 (plasmid) [Aneurinibacillus sp. Ricciae_BoGa-3]|uniref:hypothetical protein n=1 Tax=Aneurinibacillus sp. Ricciae_BoGa-3 TaxID=3022697 RepID=UPI002340119B|nr:hypothetical protein [Aneurinibacillus sp. Ricciae_BoGa-3]WCK57337.1 hypothetical protein PP175_29545 [Aneurinibacillus sp. Ricciae_BoGa-3]